MVVIKRDGQEEVFQPEKIENAIKKAFAEAEKFNQVGDGNSVSKSIASALSQRYLSMNRTISVEDIQDDVEMALMERGEFVVARCYIRYRYDHELKRSSSTLDKKIMAIVENVSEEAIQENSNKNPTILSTQRDYIAGEISRDITNRLLLPEDIRQAHEDGIIHFHDSDYFIQHSINCCLINLDDILQNGTVISGTLIEKPHSFSTACNVATQVVAQVASNQQGGQSISLAHLAPFVDVSRQKIRKQVEAEVAAVNGGKDVPEDVISKITEERVMDEVRRGVQTIQYQVITLMTTNGQAPFVTVFMWLDEVEDPQTKKDLALIIEETVRQRYQGVKNEKGVWITTAFPKLIYVLDEDNIHEDSPYYYLTELCAKCSVKRFVPDYISAKKMREHKLSKGETEGHGDVYPCMGCVAGDEVIVYRIDGEVYVESFSRAWSRMSMMFSIKTQPGRDNDQYIDLNGVEIYDNVNGWAACCRMIRNHESSMLRIKFSNGRTVDCTDDHPFETENRGVVLAKDLTKDDVVSIDKECLFVSDKGAGNEDYAWMLGVLLCDSSYVNRPCISIAATGEDEIKERIKQCAKVFWDTNTTEVVQSRDKKGTYIDIFINGDGKRKSQEICSDLVALFGGRNKMGRHIPNEVFSWSTNARMAFVAGMIDADGYINDTGRVPCVQIGSTNKELAIQQALLVQTLGMRASVYLNHYKGEGRGDTIRYQVTFYPSKELVSFVSCKKKRDKFNDNEPKNVTISSSNFSSFVSAERLSEKQPSYDVTTASEHFTVSGIYSHNCRSFLTPDRSGNGFDNIANAGNYQPGKPKYYGRLTIMLGCP